MAVRSAMRSILPIVLLAGIACGAGRGARASALAPSSSSDATDAIVRRAAERFLADTNAVGVSVGVYHRGRSRAYGFGVADGATRAPATPSTIYAIASLTKTFTGALLARAELEGRLRLEDDVRRHLGGAFPNFEHHGKPITLLTLLNHTSGLPRGMPLPESFARDDFMRELARVTLDTVPGARFGYSNAGVQLLGFVLEDVYGRPFDTLVDSLIARPLGMTSTRIAVRANDRARVATGYDERRRPAPLPPLSLQAAGALTSSVDDMVRYVAWQVREQDPVVRGTRRAIFGDSVAWAAKQPGYTMGYGWQMFRAPNGGLRIFQDGAVPGYAAQCVLFPELDLGIVVLSNQLDPSAPKRLSALVDEIATGLESRAPRGP